MQRDYGMLVEKTRRVLEALNTGAEPAVVSRTLQERGELLEQLAGSPAARLGIGSVELQELRALEREVVAAFERQREQIAQELQLLRRARSAAAVYGPLQNGAAAVYLDREG